MKLPRRKWEVQAVIVDRDGIILQRERLWKYWTRRGAIREMERHVETVRWGFEGYRPTVMVMRIR